MNKTHTPYTTATKVRNILTRYRVDLDYRPYLVCESADCSPYAAAVYEVHILDRRGRLYRSYVCTRCAARTRREARGQVVRVKFLGDDEPDRPDPQLTIEGL